MKKPASSPAIAKAAAGKNSATKPSAAKAARTKSLAKSATTKIVKSSKVDLASNTKSQIAGLLNARLADGIDLALLTKQAHWNLKGPGFIGVHLMLDGFRKELDDHVDTVAERIAQLGGIAFGTTQTTAASTSLKPYPTEIVSVRDHLDALIARYAETANLVREAIDASDEAGDAGTADLLTAYSRMLDKALWFLQSNLPG
ncbi:MAG TPA: DNA starvation/stationary phase protection protein Dps [Bosea sp. (in: a-proteobacteria)]|jgi:starvation-inducible DNA-binding protein|uniref:DNA starvation/stationary phase protection protein Dps n=1 Tax=Bosea sp. (in: a-proteobacteria) TaxID=1871050 RepID=UPI002E0EFEF1|nr:DNA starvation/stationary phase protection protein Dps [Bosea sp. (in: a-proteobacteria)]